MTAPNLPKFDNPYTRGYVVWLLALTAASVWHVVALEPIKKEDVPNADLFTGAQVALYTGFAGTGFVILVLLARFIKESWTGQSCCLAPYFKWLAFGMFFTYGLLVLSSGVWVALAYKDDKLTEDEQTQVLSSASFLTATAIFLLALNAVGSNTVMPWIRGGETVKATE